MKVMSKDQPYRRNLIEHVRDARDAEIPWQEARRIIVRGFLWNSTFYDFIPTSSKPGLKLRNMKRIATANRYYIRNGVELGGSEQHSLDSNIKMRSTADYEGDSLSHHEDTLFHKFLRYFVT